MYSPIVLPVPEASRGPSQRGILLCDRDGVIIEDRPHFVRVPSDVVLLPGSVSALVHASQAGYPVVIISNQSCIGRRAIAEHDAVKIHRELVSTLCTSGVRILGSFLCPHAPELGCECRKPSPRMLIAAMAAYGGRPSATAFIGDSRSDMEAAVRAGVLPVLVRTGRGYEQEALVRGEPLLRSAAVTSDLSSAVRHACACLRTSLVVSDERSRKGAALPRSDTIGTVPEVR